VDINMSLESHAPFAGVIFDYKSVGAAAVDMVINNLLRNIHGVPEQPVHCYIQGKWQDGTTVCAQPRGASAAKAKTRVKAAKELLIPEAFHPLARKAKPTSGSTSISARSLRIPTAAERKSPTGRTASAFRWNPAGR